MFLYRYIIHGWFLSFIWHWPKFFLNMCNFRYLCRPWKTHCARNGRHNFCGIPWLPEVVLALLGVYTLYQTSVIYFSPKWWIDVSELQQLDLPEGDRKLLSKISEATKYRGYYQITPEDVQNVNWIYSDWEHFVWEYYPNAWKRYPSGAIFIAAFHKENVGNDTMIPWKHTKPHIPAADASWLATNQTLFDAHNYDGVVRWNGHGRHYVTTNGLCNCFGHTFNNAATNVIKGMFGMSPLQTCQVENHCMRLWEHAFYWSDMPKKFRVCHTYTRGMWLYTAILFSGPAIWRFLAYARCHKEIRKPGAQWMNGWWMFLGISYALTVFQSYAEYHWGSFEWGNEATVAVDGPYGSAKAYPYTYRNYYMSNSAREKLWYEHNPGGHNHVRFYNTVLALEISRWLAFALNFISTEAYCPDWSTYAYRKDNVFRATHDHRPKTL